MWERLQRFRALDSASRGIFLRGVALLPVISLSLRLRGFRATQAVLQRLLPPLNGPADGRAAAEVAQTARMIRAAAHHGIGRTTCLQESLALWWLLGRQGIASSVRIGAHKAAGQFQAHAWVECDGAALNEDDGLHRHYSAFDAAFPVRPPESG